MTQAAEHIMSRQPAVSLHVRLLEKEFGVELFKRHGRRIVLTHAGRMLYKRAMPIVEAMDRIRDTFDECGNGGAEGVLRIGACGTLASHLLPKYIECFRERWPEVGIQIRIGTGEQHLEWLRGYELDLVVGSMDVVPPDIDFYAVTASEFVLITAPDHALAGRESVGIEEVAAYPFVGHTASSYISEAMEFMLRCHGVALDVVVEVDGWSVIKNYVAAGVGISLVPALCLTEHDRLCRVPFKGAVPPRRYGAITRRAAMLPLVARRYLHTMVTALAESPRTP